MASTVEDMRLQEILERHGIHTIRKLCQETGMSRQRGWMLWHGKAGVGKATAKLLHEKLGISLEELIQVDPVPYTGARKPAPPTGRPKRGRDKGDRS
jgi:transcriptional regulator with XRE-family HTH domain